MVELSEQQIERNNTENEDIRITAWKFYTYEYQVNVITSIFGNGVPSLGNSQWAKQYEKWFMRIMVVMVVTMLMWDGLDFLAIWYVWNFGAINITYKGYVEEEI